MSFPTHIVLASGIVEDGHYDIGWHNDQLLFLIEITGRNIEKWKRIHNFQNMLI